MFDAGRSVPLCFGVVLLGLIVQCASWIKGDTLVFPGVPAILRAFFRLLGEGRTWTQIGVTLGHLAATLGIASVIGILLGLAQGLSAFVYRLFRPLMSFLRAIPMIVLTVIVMVMTAYERVPVAASSMILIPMIAEAAAEGCRRIEPELIDVYRMNSGLNLQVIARVYLPLMGGYLRQAWVNAAGMGIRMVVTTEYLVQAKNSLGKAVFTSGYFLEYEEIYAYALIMILMVLGIGAVPKAADRLIRLCRSGRGEQENGEA